MWLFSFFKPKFTRALKRHVNLFLFLQEQKEQIAVDRLAADADRRFQVSARGARHQQRNRDQWIRPVRAQGRQTPHHVGVSNNRTRLPVGERGNVLVLLYFQPLPPSPFTPVRMSFNLKIARFNANHSIEVGGVRLKILNRNSYCALSVYVLEVF